ncbi:hypothetical protein APHAL10511_007676 [Amanita phalloides]|nr:hypothetical protein APHAL10511_007676 [Amanita phalloides]
MPEYPNLLTQIRSISPVDLDSLDSSVAERYAARGEPFVNMTSNQIFAYNHAIGDGADILKDAIKQVAARGLDTSAEGFSDEVADLFIVLAIKNIYPHILGKVHAQASPTRAHDTKKTVNHAKKLVDLFVANGIAKDRVCIKIPSTVEALIACSQLSKMGIQTLGTAIFSVPQALAASQAGCIHISPYLWELRVHFDKSFYKEYASPVTEHHSIQEIQAILEAYAKVGSKTIVIPASVVKPVEVVALASIRSHRLTLFPAILETMEGLPAVPANELVAPKTPALDASIVEKDYLAEDGLLLRQAIEADSEVSRKLEDALTIFGQYEKDLVIEIKRVARTI